MTWNNQPTQDGVYYVRVYGQSNRYWRYHPDRGQWIKLESFQDNDKDFYKWILEKRNGFWYIRPFQNPSFGLNFSGTEQMYWYHGYPQPKAGPSLKWSITNNYRGSSISREGSSDVLDCRMGTPYGRDAEGCVHFYDPGVQDNTNQNWEFQSVS